MYFVIQSEVHVLRRIKLSIHKSLGQLSNLFVLPRCPPAAHPLKKSKNQNAIHHRSINNIIFAFFSDFLSPRGPPLPRSQVTYLGHASIRYCALLCSVANTVPVFPTLVREVLQAGYCRARRGLGVSPCAPRHYTSMPAWI